MANLIQIIIQAKDDASSVLKGITGTLDSVGDGAIKAGTSMTLLTAPIAGFLGTALKEASDQEAALAQLNAVIKSTGGVAGVTSQMSDDLANSLAKVTRFSDEATLGAENMLLTFTSIGKDIFPDVTKVVLDMSTALGQDLKSSAIQVGKALNDPITGLTALRRVGVQFTEAQKNQIESLQKSGDLMGAQKIILAELSREFGGSAVAAGHTFAGGLDILNHSAQALEEKIGYLLMPILQKVTGVISDVITRVTDWTTKNPRLTQMIVLFAAALVAVGPALIGIGTGIKVVSFALTALTSPIGIIIAALGALALAYSQNFLGIRDKLAPILKTLGEGFATIGRDIGLFIARLKEGGIGEALGGLFLKFEDGSSTIKELLESFGVVPSVAEAVATALNNIFSPIITLIQDVSNAFQRGGLIGAFNQFFAALEDGSTLVTKFLEAFGVLPSTAQTISDAFGKVVGVVDDVTMGILRTIDDFVQGFQTNIQLVPFYAQYYLGGLWGKLQPLLQPILDWFNGTGPNSFGGAITAAGAIISSAFASIAGTVQDWGKKIGDAFSGGHIVQTVTDIATAVIAFGAAFLIAKGIMLVAALPTAIGEFGTALSALITVGLGPVGVALLLTGALLLAYKTNWMGFADTVNGPIKDSLDLLAGHLEKPQRLLTSMALALALITGGQDAFKSLASSLSVLEGAAQAGSQPPAQPHPGDMVPMNPFPSSPPPAVRETVGGSGTPFHNMGTAYGSYGGYQGGTHDFRGPYSANTPYLIGRGAQPEVFIPSSSGIAVPNADRLGGGGRRFTWNGDLNVPPNSSINVNREQVYSWMDSWAEEVGIYG